MSAKNVISQRKGVIRQRKGVIRQQKGVICQQKGAILGGLFSQGVICVETCFLQVWMN